MDTSSHGPYPPRAARRGPSCSRPKYLRTPAPPSPPHRLPRHHRSCLGRPAPANGSPAHAPCLSRRNTEPSLPPPVSSALVSSGVESIPLPRRRNTSGFGHPNRISTAQPDPDAHADAVPASFWSSRVQHRAASSSHVQRRSRPRQATLCVAHQAPAATAKMLCATVFWHTLSTATLKPKPKRMGNHLLHPQKGVLFFWEAIRNRCARERGKTCTWMRSRAGAKGATEEEARRRIDSGLSTDVAFGVEEEKLRALNQVT